ncbi:MAG: SDR family oxidoreductase [Thermomicrobiales bacterium]
MPRPLVEQVVVLTGASSGIGRATAHLFAWNGASMVLAARDRQGLEAAAREVAELGGRAVVVPTDVSEAAQVQHLANEAIAAFGRIDTWVNGASVSVYGLVSDVTIEDLRRVIEVNLLGTIYGAKIALPYLKETQGTLINISSVLGKMAVPLQAPYTAAKHGVIGFTDALRLELDHEKTGVTATTILPSSINTPFFSHARSYLPVEPQPIPPVYPPELVAEAIVWAAAHPTREIVVGGAGKGMVQLAKLSPALVEKGMSFADAGVKLQESNRPNDDSDNLFAPAPGLNRVHGDFGSMTLPYLGNGHGIGKQLLGLAAVVGVVAVMRQAGRGMR